MATSYAMTTRPQIPEPFVLMQEEGLHAGFAAKAGEKHASRRYKSCECFDAHAKDNKRFISDPTILGGRKGKGSCVVLLEVPQHENAPPENVKENQQYYHQSDLLLYQYLLYFHFKISGTRTCICWESISNPR